MNIALLQSEHELRTNFPHKGSLIIAQWTILTIVRVFLPQNVLDIGYVCV